MNPKQIEQPSLYSIDLLLQKGGEYGNNLSEKEHKHIQDYATCCIRIKEFVNNPIFYNLESINNLELAHPHVSHVIAMYNNIVDLLIYQFDNIKACDHSTNYEPLSIRIQYFTKYATDVEHIKTIESAQAHIYMLTSMSYDCYEILMHTNTILKTVTLKPSTT